MEDCVTEASSDTSRGRRLNNSPIIVLITLGIALFGAVTGGISFYRDQRVDAYLTAYYEPGQRARTLQIGIVNNSSRGISIVSGKLTLGTPDNEPIAEVARVSRDVQAGIGQRQEMEFFSATEGLPFAIDAGQSLAGTMLFRMPEDANQKIQDQHNSVLVPALANERKNYQVWLWLNITPGGSINAHVQMPATFSDSGLMSRDYAAGWESTLVLDGRRRVVRISIEAREPSLGTLQLWRIPNRKPVFKATQPIFESQSAIFVLPGLPSGKYEWAVTVGGRAVIVSNFTQPCTDEGAGRPRPNSVRWKGQAMSWDCPVRGR
jgi:hypothetical protein